jgi:hypothetical protein
MTGFEDYSLGHTELHTPSFPNGGAGVPTIDLVNFKYGNGSCKTVLNQNFTYPDSADWYLPGSFTFSQWTYITAAHHTYWISQFENAQNYMAIHIYRIRTELIIRTSNIMRVYLDKSFAALADGWHHFEFGVQSGVSGYIFIDGTKLVLDSNILGGAPGDISSILHFGWYNTAWSDTNIDVSKLDKGICRHNANFVVPANEDVGNDANTVLLLKYNLGGYKRLVNYPHRKTMIGR